MGRDRVGMIAGGGAHAGFAAAGGIVVGCGAWEKAG